MVHAPLRRPPILLAAIALAACAPASPKSPAAPGASPPTAPGEADPLARARRLAHRFLIADGHVDVPYRLYATRDPDGRITENIAGRTPEGDFDAVRAREGGLDAPFMSIYVPAKHQIDGTAKTVAKTLVDMVRGFEARWPDTFALATSADEIEAAFAAGKIALPMGLENGAPIERVEDVQTIHDWGIRYVTLTHSKDNALADSSFDDRHTHGGLSELGKAVVREMNRVGIMVDVSHLSDDAIRDVLAIAQAPVIASHSSARKFTPGWQRNLSDELIRGVAATGGIVMVNFGSSFLDDEVRKAREKRWEAIEALLAERGLSFGEPEAKKIADAYDREHPGPRTTVERVADHIDHIVSLVGVEHVGFGSDFDGVGDSLPEGLRDVSAYPNLLRVLLERGYTEPEIEAICGKNLLRVLRAVEAHARRSAAG